MNYTVKFVVIISIVAVVSFFTASVIIPEKSAVAPNRKKSAQRALAPLAPRPGDIPIVVADGKPAEKPILVSGTGLAPHDINALTPAPLDAGAAAAGAKAPAAVGAPVNAKAPPAADAKAPPVAAVEAKAPAPGAKSATFSAIADDAAAAAFVARPPALQTDSRSAPPNTMAARLKAEFAQAKAKAADTAKKAAPAPPAVAAAPAAVPPPVAAALAAAPPDTAKKKKPDPNAPLGYKLATTAVCAAVENRAPKGVADKFPKESGAVYYFTHVVGAADTSSAVMHRWYREGKLIQTSILQIKSSNWRTHSKRNLATVEEPAGNWRVEVVDQKSGKVLEAASFVVE